METPRKGKRYKGDKASDIEVHPDAWERFEKAFDTVMKGPSRSLGVPRVAAFICG